MKRFLLSAGVAAAGVLAAAALIGLRSVVESFTILLLLVFAWPVVLLLIAFIASLFTEEDSGAGEAAIEGGAHYYYRLARLRNPWVWGALVGTIVATAGLQGYVRGWVAPREDRARSEVQALARKLDEECRRTGRFPDAKGEHLHEALGLRADEPWQGLPLRDPWNRPYRYSLERGTVTSKVRVGTGDISAEATAIERRGLLDRLLQ